MIDFFTFQILILTTLSTLIASSIFFIKNKNQESVKFGIIYVICLLFVNIYQFTNLTLLIGSIPLILLIKNTNYKLASYYLILTSIGLINSTYTNFWYVLLANLAIIGSYFIIFSKLIFKNQTETQKIIIDQKDWQELLSQNTLNDKLQSLTNSVIKSIKIESIDTVSELVTIMVKYER